jgi:hypothetical protein
MLSRIIYRIVSVFFLLASITCWICAAICVVGFIANGSTQLFFYGVLFPILGFGMAGCCRDAWRAARHDPLYHDYP